MKQSIISLQLKSILTVFIIIMLNIVSLSQPPPPPQGSSGSQFNNSGNEADAAPIGEGIWIMIALAASYGVSRYMRKTEKIPENQLLQVSEEDVIQ